MARTQKLWTEPPRPSGRLSPSIVVASLLTAMLMAYVLLVFHRPLVHAVAVAWSTWGGKPAWALSTVAVGAIVCAASLCLMTLAAVARGVHAAPYAWAAPVLIGAAVLQASQLETQPPIAQVSVVTFSASSGLLMLVGGALLQIRGWTYRVSGLLLLTLPLLAVWAGYWVAPGGPLHAFAQATEATRMFLLTLVVTWVGTGMLSFATRQPRPMHNASHQLERWKERAQRGEIRLAQAQRRAEIAEHRLIKQSGMTRVAPHPAPASPTGSSAPYAALAALCLTIALLAGYALAYRPLQGRVREQHAALLAATRAHALALEAAVEQFESQRAELATQLAHARAAVRAHPRPSGPPPRRPGPEPRASVRNASATPAPARAAERAEVIDDDPIGGLE